MKTGEKIKQRRLELNMTMEDLGNAIGVQRSAINKYEKGLIDIKSSTLTLIAHALDVPVGSLLDDLDDQPYTPKTVEARSRAKGMDTMPEARRKAFMEFMISMAPDIFKEGTENDDT